MLGVAHSSHIIVFSFWKMGEAMAFVYSDVRLAKLLSILAYYRNYLEKQFPKTQIHIYK